MKKHLLPIFIIVLVLSLPIIFLRSCASLPAEPPKEGENFSSWITVSGVVTGLHYWKPVPGHPGGLTIYYEYFVSGKNYKFESFRWVFLTDEKEVDDIFTGYTKGSKIIVYFNPLKPQQSYVLKPNPSVMY